MIEKILVAYATDTFCGSLDTEPVSWFWFTDLHFLYFLSENYLSGEEAQLSVARIATHAGASASSVVPGATATAAVSAKKLYSLVFVRTYLVV